MVGNARRWRVLLSLTCAQLGGVSRVPSPNTPFLKGEKMFSVRQKREIAEKVQAILRETGHPELPESEIPFRLQVNGATAMSWADIRNNGAVDNPGVNPHNERQDPCHETPAPK